MRIVDTTIAFFATLPGHIAHTVTTNPNASVVTALALVAAALLADIVRQLHRSDDIHQVQPNPLRQDGPSWSGPRRDHQQMRAALDVLADHGRHRPVPPPPRIDWTAYPTAAPTERYIGNKVRQRQTESIIDAKAAGIKRCGIRRHRLTRRMMAARAWSWWWAGRRTALGWWWYTHVIAAVRAWWAQTTPTVPWAPVVKALTASPAREQVAVVWAPRGQVWIPTIVPADQVPVTRSPLTGGMTYWSDDHSIRRNLANTEPFAAAS